MYTALLLVIAKNWKQPPCPSIDEQKNKPWYNRTLFILFSSRKKWAIQLQKRHKENVNVYQVKSEIWKNYLLYNSNYMIIRVRGCTEQTESKSEVQVRHFGTPWTAVYQAPPFMGFSRQEYWSGLPFPSPEDLPDPGIELRSPAL